MNKTTTTRRRAATTDCLFNKTRNRQQCACANCEKYRARLASAARKRDAKIDASIDARLSARLSRDRAAAQMRRADAAEQRDREYHASSLLLIDQDDFKARKRAYARTLRTLEDDGSIDQAQTLDNVIRNTSADLLTLSKDLDNLINACVDDDEFKRDVVQAIKRTTMTIQTIAQYAERATCTLYSD